MSVPRYRLGATMLLRWASFAARSLWIRVLVTAGLLAIVATQIEWGALGRRISGGQPGWVAVAITLLMLALIAGALRWQALLRVAGIRLGYRDLGRVYAISTFGSTFLPTNVGGDVARALLVARRGRMLGLTVITVVVDRAAAFAGLIAVAVFAWLVDPGAVPAGQATALLAVGGLCVAGTLALGVLLLRPPPWAAARIPERIAGWLVELRIVLVACWRRPGVTVGILAASVIFQVLIVLQTCALARAFSIDLSFPMAAVAVALVTLAMLIPLSVAGFGIREGGYVALLAGVGISATDATLVSLATVAALFVAGLPGAYLLARRGMAPALRVS